MPALETKLRVVKPMKASIVSFVSIGLLLGSSLPALADSRRHPRHTHHVHRLDNSPSAIAERQRHASTFDNTQYFEHDSNKIPLGTLEWWDQKAREGH
jgi:hypothetical protein